MDKSIIVPLFKMSVNQSDKDAVIRVLNRGTQWAIGPEIDEFEKAICDYMKVKYCVTFNSGTSALHATMLAYGIKKGDEVIVPSFTFIATANCVKMVGATPIFADIEDTSYGLDYQDVEKRITKRTKAIICVHYAGGPCQVAELRATANKYKLLLIEDTAEAMGAEVNGVKCGTIGDAGVLSFCQNKIITTGEGGAVITDNEDVYRKLRLIRSHGREEGDYFGTDKLDYISLGYNWRMPSMNAALGLSQLRRIDELISRRQDKALSYVINLSEFHIIYDNSFVFQMFSIICPDRDNLMKYLRDNGVSCGVWFYPVHKTKYYKGSVSLPVTERVCKKILSLPMYPDLTTREIEYVSKTIADYYE